MKLGTQKLKPTKYTKVEIPKPEMLPEEEKPMVKPEKAIPKALEPLAKEARKEYNTPEIIEARKKSNSIPETININTPERFKLRIDLVLGTPASGKSSRLAEPLAKKYGSIIIDSDQIKKELPEYNNGIGSKATHKESAIISDKMILKKAMSNNDNIVFPRLGKNANTIEMSIDELIKKGYKVHIHYMDLPIKEAANRAVTRYKETGRFVDPDFIINNIGDKPKMTYNKIKNKKGVLSYEAYSNEVPKGQKPVLIERTVGRTGKGSLHRYDSNKNNKKSANEKESQQESQKSSQKESQQIISNKATLTEPKVEVKPEPTKEDLATPAQIKKAHAIANSKAMISEKGKIKPQYRRLATAMTGKKSIKVYI